MKLSLCTIVKDEETSLPVCLGSVKDVVDEMVIVDTGSQDRTPEIAKEFGAKVINFTWNDDFASARNYSLQAATGDWILVLDADEVLSQKIIPDLRQILNKEDLILTNLVRHEVGASQSPYSLVSRLFRNRPEIQFSHPYHAIVDDSVLQLCQREPHWQIADLKAVAIEHYGYQPGTIIARDKVERAKAAMERYLQQYPDDAYTCSKLGALYVEIGKFMPGIELLEKGLITVNNPLVRYELHYHLGIAYSRQGELDKAKKQYQLAAELPILPQVKLGAYNNWGNLLKAEGNLSGAILAYQKTIEIDPRFAFGHYNLGLVWKQMGRLEFAIAAYQKAIELNPMYAEAYQNLGVTLLKGGNVTASLKAFSQAITLHEQFNPSEAERIRKELRTLGFQL